MPTFIDESGDVGSVTGGGTPYFRLAAVWVPSYEEAEAFRERVREVRRELPVRANYEFKFANTHQNPEHRRKFFEAALSCEFRFAVSLIDKTDAYWRRSDRQELHWACATELAALLRPIYQGADEARGKSFKEQVVVDDNGDERFLTVVKDQFRGLRSSRRLGSPFVGKVLFRKSTPDEMLQLVDMVCGAVGDWVDSVDSPWYDIIAERDVERRLRP